MMKRRREMKMIIEMIQVKTVIKMKKKKTMVYSKKILLKYIQANIIVI
jgi:hypothetical protein